VQKKHIVSVIIGLALITMIVIAIVPHSQHGDKEAWIQGHGKGQYARETPDKCIACHKKQRGETKENFCNKCHVERGVKPIK